MRVTVRPRLAALIVSCVLAFAMAAEYTAYESGVRAEARATARVSYSPDYCLSCHTGPTIMRMMADKEDNQGRASFTAGAAVPGSDRSPLVHWGHPEVDAGYSQSASK